MATEDAGDVSATEHDAVSNAIEITDSRSFMCIPSMSPHRKDIPRVSIFEADCHKVQLGENHSYESNQPALGAGGSPGTDLY